MARKSPLNTLLAGGVLGVGLLIASMANTPDQSAVYEQPVAGETGAPTIEPTDNATQPEPADTATETDVSPEPDESAEPTPQPTDGEPTTYVGYVDSEEATVAVIIDDDEATAYVCDGVNREAWLSGTAVDGELDLSGDEGSLTASYDGSTAEGETTVDGQTWTFQIEQVDPPEGLYRFADTISGGAEVVGGWIVLPDGNQVGIVSVDGESQPAAQLDTETGQVTVEGEAVMAERQG